MIEESKKARLIWHCRRGMLELDLLLGAFLKTSADTLTLPQVTAFEKLLDYSDPQILAWIMNLEKPHDTEIAFIVDFIKLHHKV